MKTVCVFCGSSTGSDPAFAEAARAMGAALGRRGTRLVYGGGSVGLMGIVADATLQAGGEAVGVIPQALLDREVGHRNLTKLHVVETMHQRKAIMADLAEAFVALPGGVGTLEETFEIWTWGLLGIHRKPCGILNVNGYYDRLLEFIRQTVELGFVRSGHAAMLQIGQDPHALLDRLEKYEPPDVQAWLSQGQR